MSNVWYGNLHNRLEENKQFCDEIKVGTGATEYFYSDRHAYEVIEVKDQKHVVIREYSHKPIGEYMSNQWELISDENNRIMELTKRGKYWYNTVIATIEDIIAMEQEENINKKLDIQLWLAHNDFDIETIKTKGKQTKYHRVNISFGKADYYYDYEF